ncbi:MAG: alpha/beta fold hydrolase [Rhodospirillaceae bacterium]|mgnify:FL=1|jgi:homoserine O-acetyltransferase/O-succinyltransferase|nr:alpha/beta fold hydrolase [Rhodospirillaceae bacterium]MBT4491212.1 alpha/beta fold hydrolase [Rhodospirillaceae bacterium]MBT5193944.1 alpha/beta fold hydrolase [Rhodospirillaceae bacterium]MBT6428895.1 alpha/beta fold hydrolase [Rhodospirillaceae bacterium]MBT7757830.1 alpha/beta fold hydrolase [Rhodospirillaceae bacterium]
MNDYKVFELGNLRLQCGMVLPNAQLTYQTYGTLAADKSNVILYPTSYGAHHMDIEWLIGPGRILDSDKYFILIPNMFGNGLSSSPSNMAEPYGMGRFPAFSHWDNIQAQRRMLAEVFAIDHLALVYGWSMGAQQALHWGAIFPDQVAAICAICGSARTSPHNKVFLEGVRATLTADPAWHEGGFTARPVRGLRAMGRLYAGWAMSQAFYREGKHLELGFASLEDYLVRAWEANFLRRNGDDLLSMLATWYHSDISNNEIFDDDLTTALGAIKPRAMIMPSRTDLYFTPEDAEAECKQMPNAEFRPIESIWGHRAGNPIDNEADETFLRQAVTELLGA